MYDKKVFEKISREDLETDSLVKIPDGATHFYYEEDYTCVWYAGDNPSRYIYFLKKKD